MHFVHFFLLQNLSVLIAIANYRHSWLMCHVKCSEEVIDVHAGDQHIMRYKPIAALVSSGDAVLI